MIVQLVALVGRSGYTITTLLVACSCFWLFFSNLNVHIVCVCVDVFVCSFVCGCIAAVIVSAKWALQTCSCMAYV